MLLHFNFIYKEEPHTKRDLRWQTVYAQSHRHAGARRLQLRSIAQPGEIGRAHV